MTRLRITVSGLMMIVAVVAVDFAVLGAMSRAGNRVFLVGAMPMADVLAVFLASTVGRLRRRGEAPLSRVMFLLGGGMALIFLVYFVHLRPDLVYIYVLNTIWRMSGGHPLVNLLLVWLAVSASILVPALILGRSARGYRLKLTACIDGQSEVASRD